MNQVKAVRRFSILPAPHPGGGALRLGIPLNAQYIRNIIVAAHAMHDRIVHFITCLRSTGWTDVCAIGAM